MDHPWLAVPLAEYEGHMSAPGVEQLEALSSIFAEVLAARRPRSVAVLGVAGGNGLDRIDRARTTRVVGVDINRDYLEAVRRRYAGVPGLELHAIDLAIEDVRLEPVELVHAALVFEHAGVERCLANAVALLRPDGWLCVVLQLPSEQTPAVAPTSYSAMASLASHFQFVQADDLVRRLAAYGLDLMHQARRPLASGKAFWLGLFGSRR